MRKISLKDGILERVNDFVGNYDDSNNWSLQNNFSENIKRLCKSFVSDTTPGNGRIGGGLDIKSGRLTSGICFTQTGNVMVLDSEIKVKDETGKKYLKFSMNRKGDDHELSSGDSKKLIIDYSPILISDISNEDKDMTVFLGEYINGEWKSAASGFAATHGDDIHFNKLIVNNMIGENVGISSINCDNLTVDGDIDCGGTVHVTDLTSTPSINTGKSVFESISSISSSLDMISVLNSTQSSSITSESAILNDISSTTITSSNSISSSIVSSNNFNSEKISSTGEIKIGDGGVNISGVTNIGSSITINGNTGIITANGFVGGIGSVPILEIGQIVMSVGDKDNSSWKECKGGPMDKDIYHELFSVIGYKYGGGGQTFNLPDYNARFPVGTDVYPGVACLGFGESSIKLQVNELPKHRHSYKTPKADKLKDNNRTNADFDYWNTPATFKSSISSDIGGSDGKAIGHNNMPRYTGFKFFIRYQ